MADQCRAGSPVATSAGFLPETGDSPRVLILGSFPSVKSLELCEYYGNPQNHFWKIMVALFAIDHRLPYRDRIPYRAPYRTLGCGQELFTKRECG